MYWYENVVVILFDNKCCLSSNLSFSIRFKFLCFITFGKAKIVQALIDFDVDGNVMVIYEDLKYG